MTRTDRAADSGVPRDRDLQDLFTSATDDVVLRRDVQEVLVDARTLGSEGDPSAAPGLRRAALASLAVAAVVAGIIGVGGAMLPDTSTPPAAPAPADPARPGPDPAPGATPRPLSDLELLDVTEPLTFFVTGEGETAGLVSSRRPDDDLGAAVIDAIRGTGNPEGSTTGWNGGKRLGITIVEREDGTVVVDLDPGRLIASRSARSDTADPAPALLFDDDAARRLALQQVAWTARAHRGPGTEVEFRVLGRAAGESTDVDLPDLVAAEPDAFAPLQLDRPRSTVLRNGFVLEGFTTGKGMRWALVSRGSGVRDPFAEDGGALPRGVPIRGSHPGDRDETTGRHAFRYDVSTGGLIPVGDYRLVVEALGVRRSIPVSVRR